MSRMTEMVDAFDRLVRRVLDGRAQALRRVAAIEMLQPPAGARMKVVRFKGWTPQHGPDYQVDDVQPHGRVQPHDP